jgi:hypothetical protein
MMRYVILRNHGRSACTCALLLGVAALASCLAPPPVSWSLEERWAMHSGQTVEVHNRSGGPIEVFVRRGGVEALLGQVRPDSLGTFFYRGPRPYRGDPGDPRTDLTARDSSGEEVRLRPGGGVRGGRLRFVADRPRGGETNRARAEARAPPRESSGAGWPALETHQRAGVPRASTWMKGPRTAFVR